MDAKKNLDTLAEIPKDGTTLFEVEQKIKSAIKRKEREKSPIAIEKESVKEAIDREAFSRVLETVFDSYKKYDTDTSFEDKLEIAALTGDQETVDKLLSAANGNELTTLLSNSYIQGDISPIVLKNPELFKKYLTKNSHGYNGFGHSYVSSFNIAMKLGDEAFAKDMYVLAKQEFSEKKDDQSYSYYPLGTGIADMAIAAGDTDSLQEYANYALTKRFQSDGAYFGIQEVNLATYIAEKTKDPLLVERILKARLDPQFKQEWPHQQHEIMQLLRDTADFSPNSVMLVLDKLNATLDAAEEGQQRNARHRWFDAVKDFAPMVVASGNHDTLQNLLERIHDIAATDKKNYDIVRDTKSLLKTLSKLDTGAVENTIKLLELPHKDKQQLLAEIYFNNGDIAKAEAFGFGKEKYSSDHVLRLAFAKKDKEKVRKDSQYHLRNLNYIHEIIAMGDIELAKEQVEDFSNNAYSYDSKKVEKIMLLLPYDREFVVTHLRNIAKKFKRDLGSSSYRSEFLSFAAEVRDPILLEELAQDYFVKSSNNRGHMRYHARDFTGISLSVKEDNHEQVSSEMKILELERALQAHDDEAAHVAYLSFSQEELGNSIPALSGAAKTYIEQSQFDAETRFLINQTALYMDFSDTFTQETLTTMLADMSKRQEIAGFYEKLKSLDIKIQFGFKEKMVESYFNTPELTLQAFDVITEMAGWTFNPTFVDEKIFEKIITLTPEQQQRVSQFLKTAQEESLYFDLPIILPIFMDNMENEEKIFSVARLFKEKGAYGFRDIVFVSKERVSQILALSETERLDACNFLIETNILSNQKFSEQLFLHFQSDRAGALRAFNVLKKLPKSYFNAGESSTIDSLLEKIGSISDSQIDSYAILFEKIDLSPSPEIQKLKHQILTSVINAPSPEEAFYIIENVFVKNNLPMAEKIFKIFRLIYRDTLIGLNDQGSPALLKASKEERLSIIHQDLLSIHLKSGNRSLRTYLQILESGQKVLDKAESLGFENMNYDELLELTHFFKKIATLDATNNPTGAQRGVIDLDLPIDRAYQKMRTDLGVAENMKINDHVQKILLEPLGLSSVHEALMEMRLEKKRAHERNIACARKADFTLHEGDFIKGVDNTFIANILQNGSVSKEFLGGEAVSDSTPFDTDISKVLKGHDENGLTSAYEKSMSTSYGNILFGLKNRGQYEITSQDGTADINIQKTEVFQTVNEQHWGMRTGFPTTEIDFLILADPTPQQIQSVGIEIAKNNLYIPIVDKNGSLLFSEHDYKNIRKSFRGLSFYEGESIPVAKSISKKTTDSLEALLRDQGVTRRTTESVDENIELQLMDILHAQGIDVKDKYDTSIIGAEISDTGSTGRNTHMPTSYDFDFGMRIDNFDFDKKANNISHAITSKITAESFTTEQHSSDYIQIRIKGLRNFAGRSFPYPIDLDVGISRKSKNIEYSSHDAIRDRLISIQKENGEEAYNTVIGNILLAKKVLSEGSAYKKLEHGGIGGIGVENWILLNGGSFDQAAKDFLKYAYEENGSPVPYEKFKESYSILDPGTNIKYNNHDDFAKFTLKENGYVAMRETLKKWVEN